MSLPSQESECRKQERSGSVCLYSVLRSNLSEGSTFVPSRSQTPVRDGYLGSDSEGKVDFKDTLRPGISRGGTFVGSHLPTHEQRAYLHGDSCRSQCHSARISLPSPKCDSRERERSESICLYDLLRSNLSAGSTFVSSRSQTPVRDVHLGSDSEGNVDFKDTLRPNIRRGGTFVGSHLQRAERRAYLQAGYDTHMHMRPPATSTSRGHSMSLPSQKPESRKQERSGSVCLYSVLRSNLSEGGTFVPSSASRSQTPVRDAYLGSDSEGQVEFKDTLRPNIRRGGTFVGSHLQSGSLVWYPLLFWVLGSLIQ